MRRDDLSFQHRSRRAFLGSGMLALTAAAVNRPTIVSGGQDPVLKVALITDLHYADKPPLGTRYYRETPDKLAEAAAQFAEDQPEFVVELGDLIDAADSVPEELRYLKRINNDFAAICKQRHYVLGNHCVHTLTKAEFLDGVGQRSSYYSFDEGGFHFVILDSCFRGDGEPYGRKNFEWTDPNIPKTELEWLKADLQQTTKQTVVFAHQRLDVRNQYGVKNAVEVRAVLEQSQKVLAVVQGHSHMNDYQHIGGIHYCTLVAMIEGSGVKNNGYSLMSLASDGTISITGFRRQVSYEWSS